MTGTCHGCGVPLPPNKGPGRQRKWCSERCRKDTCYVRHCVDCGVRLNSDEGNGLNAPKRCNLCRGAQQRQRSREWIIDSFREWARMFGAPPSAVDWNPAHARAVGYCAWKADRYERTGRKWPPTSTVKNNFGSWNKGLEAAGFTPLKPEEVWMGHAGVALRRKNEDA